jgi:hypothetical protein
MHMEIMNQIHQAANERHTLYRLAAKQHLTLDQTQRLHKLNTDLPLLWDRYRREYAARNRPTDLTPARRAA